MKGGETPGRGATLLHQRRRRQRDASWSRATMACACAASVLLAPHGGEALQVMAPARQSGSGNRLWHSQSLLSVGAYSRTTRRVCNTHQMQQPFRTNDKWSWALHSSLKNENGSQLESSGGGNDGSKKSPKKWGAPLQSLKRLILSLVSFVVSFPAKFKSLTKRGRIILSVQLLALGLVLGAGAKSARDARLRSAARPVEVGYSTFLDLVDVNGRGHTPGKNPALKLENVIIAKDRVGFRVVTDREKHAAALLDKKLVGANDVSVQEIPLSKKSVYAMKPPASQDLIDTLRERGVPFRAASTKASNSLATMARVSIFAIYLLFLRKMYQTMAGGGSSGGSGAPGKLATFDSGEALVRFDDIEGIDDAKFEVMELVDTLRNPKKYEILGARAPTGLLLEGPPGTGESLRLPFLLFACVVCSCSRLDAVSNCHHESASGCECIRSKFALFPVWCNRMGANIIFTKTSWAKNLSCTQIHTHTCNLSTKRQDHVGPCHGRNCRRPSPLLLRL